MAKTEFGVNHPLAVKLWSKALAREAQRRTFMNRFIGKSEDSLVQEKVDLKKSAGDEITCGLRPQLQGDGVVNDATLEGNEEAMLFYDDKVKIHMLRHATRSKGQMSEQRVPYSVRNEGMGGLADWYADRKDTVLFNHLCGYTVENRAAYIGGNTITAPTSNRILRAGNQSNDESLTSSDTFTLDLIDIARERAETASIEENTGPLIRPFNYMGGLYYVMFLHDYQVTQLRTNTATGQWQDIQKAAMQGGDVEKNPIFTGALGIYNGVVLHKVKRVTKGVNSSTNAAVDTVRRAVLCGAQAATIAYAGGSSGTKYDWNEELFDYGNQLGVGVGAKWGLKKTKFIPADDSPTNAEDYGTIVVSTYATQTNPS